MSTSPEQELQMAVEALSRELCRFRFRLIGAGLCFVLVMVIALGIFGSKSPTNLLWLSVCLTVGVVGCLLVPRQDHSALNRLEALDDVRSVGALLDALPVSLGQTHQKVKELLVCLLPKLQISDASLLSTKQRKILYGSLSQGDVLRDTAFLLAIMDALTVIGDKEAVKRVEILAQGAALNAKERAVREKARKCALLLSQQMDSIAESRSLLRPLTGTESPQILLRPTTSSNQNESDLLLSTQSPESESISPS